MPARARLRAALTTLLLLASTACAGAKTDPVVAVAPDLVRGPCRPPAGLMAAPQRLPDIKPGERMVEVSARDTAAFNALRRAMIDLQRFVMEACQ